MIKEVLESIDGVAIYPVVALVLFLMAFLGVVWWTWRLNSQDIERMRRLPLDASDATSEGERSDG